MMKKQPILSRVSIGVAVWVSGMLLISTPLLAKCPAGSSAAGGSDKQLVGIIDPDGRKHVWTLPPETGCGILRQLAAQYPSKTIYGVRYYRIPSWRGTGKLVLEINARQDVLISDLRKKIKRLETKADDGHRTRRHFPRGSSKSLSDRVKELEKQMKNDPNAGGYR